ncbi:Putative inositol-pentakisphosphate 2-kinase [Colletotrichum destructivum]|uniref:Inositol-pentakisphosphate 2-kinase n=1 Tax=Colletotrichum destructivum TaxID=34406 RepID=A0AAX4HYD0_9PEZI|nr:Putative inositol-pentakisphosphate 2-kinase [Colletotrichum destructivum]
MAKLMIIPTNLTARMSSTEPPTSKDVPALHSPSGKVFSIQVMVTDKVHVRPWTHAVYVGEGAANVLFVAFLYTKYERQHEADRTESDLLTKFLLRVPKKDKDPSKPFYHPGEQYRFFWEKIAPLFSYRADMLAEVTCARIHSDAVWHLHKVLDALDKAPPGAQSRPSKFRGDEIAGWDLLLMVESMRARSEDERVVEFKPKWLAQSPSAPKDANTCRCCALAARKFASNKDRNMDPREYPCPLWLDPERVAPDGGEVVRQKAIARLFQNSSFEDNKHASALYELLKKTTVLELLKAHQITKDTRGPLLARKDDEEFSTAMTLRDCSLYMRYRIRKVNGQETVVTESFEAKLADLDKKNAAWKLTEWQDKERALIDEGWYMGRGKMKNCALQR